MSPILEEDIITEEVEVDTPVPSESEYVDKGQGFSPPDFAKRAGELTGHSLERPREFPLPRSGCFSPPMHSALGHAPLEAPPPAAESFWPLPERVPPSPGAALVEEFDALYHKYERRVYRQCYRMLGNQEDAEDMAQEVFLQIFRKAHTFRGEANFSTWLHRLTVNTVLMQIRRHRRWRDSVTSLDVAPNTDEGVNDVLAMVSRVAAPAASNLDRIGLDVAIAQLSSGYQEIFLLHDLEGYRHDEIAKLLGISEGTSKSQLHKARLRLRALMGSKAGRDSRSSRPHAGSDLRKSRCRCFPERPGKVHAMPTVAEQWEGNPM